MYTNPNAIVDSTGAIEGLPVDYEDIEELRQEFPQDQQLTEYVIYTKKSGEKIRLLTALEKVNAMWVQEIS